MAPAETLKGYTDAFLEGSRLLFEEMALKPGDVVPLRSESRPWVTYQMLVMPDGIPIHMDEGCEGEPFNGPFACWHSVKPRRYTMTQALQRYEETYAPPAIRFTPAQLEVIKATICK